MGVRARVKRLLGRSDAARTWRALGELGIGEGDVIDRGATARAVAELVGWVTRDPLIVEDADGTPLEVRTFGGVRYDTDRALTALYALVEAGQIMLLE